MLTVALGTVPTFLAVLMGILINNHRLSDLRANMDGRFSDLRAHMDQRFTDEARVNEARFTRLEGRLAR